MHTYKITNFQIKLVMYFKMRIKSITTMFKQLVFFYI